MNRNLLALFSNNAITKKDIDSLMEVNPITRKYGIQISEEHSMEILNYKKGALLSNGRLELVSNDSIVKKLLIEFSSSPYISQDNIIEVMEDLTEAFYYFKNQCEEEMGDDDLIEFMKERFDTVCQGSVELLIQRELEHLIYSIKNKNDFEGASDE